MHTPRLSLTLLFLASAIWSQATTLTLNGSLSHFSHQSSDPDQFSGLPPVVAGDPYSLKLVFNDALLDVPFSGDDTITPNALSLLELSVNGDVLASMSNVKLQFVNDVGGRDSIYINHNGTLAVTGMNPPTFYGYVSMQIHDLSQTGFQFGQPVDFAKFFDHSTDAFNMGVGIFQNNPYSGSYSELNIGVAGDPMLAVPQSATVPDSSATFALLAIGLATFAAFRRRRD